jgi:hypothetical protein
MSSNRALVIGSRTLIMYTNYTKCACRDSENCIGIRMNIPSSKNGIISVLRRPKDYLQSAA